VFKLEQRTHKYSDYEYNVIEHANFPNIPTESLSENGTCYAQAVFVFVETTNVTRHIEVNREKLRATYQNRFSLSIH
jgi:hypothetical protein